jgi:hypothetical protein
MPDEPYLKSRIRDITGADHGWLPAANGVDGPPLSLY